MSSVRAEQLAESPARELKPLYVVHGDEPLLSLEAIDVLRARAREAGFTERSVLVAERGFKWGELAAAGASMSLFGERRLIELRIPGGKPGSEGAQAIESYCRAPPPDTLLLVSLPRLPKREQSSAWFAALARAGMLVEVWPVDRARLPDWIAQRLSRQQQRAGREALQFIADCVEGNLLAAHQEIQKLALLLAPGELDFGEVRAALLNVARYDPAQLEEAMLAGETPRLARILEGLRAEGEAAPRVLWVLAEGLRALRAVARGLAAGRPIAELCRENRVWGEPRQRLMARAARRVAPHTLEPALRRAAHIDRIAKGVTPGDPWDEMLWLAAHVARAGSPA